MIKTCWKCKGPVDTQAVDVGETVGLCGRCYDHFDKEPQKEAGSVIVLGDSVASAPLGVSGQESSRIMDAIRPSGPIGPGGLFQTVQGLPGVGIYVEPAPLKPMSGEDVAIAAHDALKMLPTGLPEADVEQIKQKLFEVLKVPTEYIQTPPKPNVPPMTEALMLLQDLITAEVRKIENSIGDQPEVDRIKTELRHASIKILKEVAPSGVLLSHIERVVDSTLAEAFKEVDYVPVQAMSGGPVMPQ